MVDLTALGLPLNDLMQEADAENANRQQQLLQRMGAVDTLTRVYNRDFFDLQFGDEADRFIVLAADMTAAQAEEHAGRIRDRVQKLKILDAPPRHYLTVSVGCAVCTPSPSDQLEDMVVSATQALARAQSQNPGKSPS